MTATESYKLGFLLKCALDGCSPAEIEQRIMTASRTKLAFDPVGAMGRYAESGSKTIKNVGETFKGLLPMLQKGLFWGTVGVPVLGGLGAGYGLSQLSDAPVSPEDAKQQELIEEYRRALGQLQRPR